MEEDIKILQDFIFNLSCLDSLNAHIDRVNIFDILKSAHHEIRHSNVLAWLFDPNANHGLGKRFLFDFIKEFIKRNQQKFNIEDWAFLDYSNIQVVREWKKNRDNSLDILILFKEDKKLIAIENKVFAKESENQTLKYRKLLEQKYFNYERMLVFLTPAGEDAQDIEWDSISYQEIYNILKEILSSCELTQTIKLVLQNYLEILGSDIMENSELVNLCSKIYKENKKALDLIYKYKKDESVEVADFLKTALKELSKENDNIIYEERFDQGSTYVRFASKYMDELLGKASQNNNTWSNTQRHLYEFHPYELKDSKIDDLSIFVTLTRDNIEDEQREIHDDIYRALYPNAKNNIKWPNKTKNLNKQKDFIPDVVAFIYEENSLQELKKKILEYVTETEDKIKEYRANKNKK